MVNSVGSSIWCCFGTSSVDVDNETDPLLKREIPEETSQPVRNATPDKVLPKSVSEHVSQEEDRSVIISQEELTADQANILTDASPNSDSSYFSGREEQIADMTPEASLAFESPYSSSCGSQFEINIAGEITPEVDIMIEKASEQPVASPIAPVQNASGSDKQKTARRHLRFED
ncbi:MAG: hypothetical protein H7A40_02805 [Chlamydiales bacterium]|nr:hypothetical protein [Chlamydiales bacterium]